VTVIVVIGEVIAREDQAGEVAPAGFSALLALAAAQGGAKVEIVSRIGDDPAGDEVLLAFARAGVGHVATLRDAGLGTRRVSDTTDAVLIEDGSSADATDAPEPGGEAVLDDGDVALALRYLTDFRVIVLVHPTDARIVSEAAAASGWASAQLVVVVLPGIEPELDVGDDVLVLSADRDAEGTAERVGAFAAAVDAGGDPDTAYAVLTAATGEP
jgi:sugar/nucleoside kinase (ribokinase family)